VAWLEIADTLNDIIELNERMAAELDRVGTVVGKEGKITQRALPIWWFMGSQR